MIQMHMMVMQYFSCKAIIYVTKSMKQEGCPRGEMGLTMTMVIMPETSSPNKNYKTIAVAAYLRVAGDTHYLDHHES